MRLYATTATVVFMLLMIGCDSSGHGPDNGNRTTVVRDSLGVTIVETVGDSARRTLDWTVTPGPDLVLGTGRLHERDEFHDVRGLQQTGEGDSAVVVVVDGASGEVRRYREGQLVDWIGGVGSGPGEFLYPVLAAESPPSDSVMISDVRNRRLTIMRGDTTVTVPIPNAGRVLGIAGGRLLTSQEIGVLHIYDEPGPHPEANPLEFRLLDVATSRVDTIARLPGRRWFQTPRDEIGQTGMFPMPFDILPSGAAGTRSVFVTAGRGPEVREFGLDGALIRIIRVDEPDREPTVADLEAFIAREVQKSPRARAVLERAYGMELSLPERIPSFDQLRVDDEGWLWARVYQYQPDAPNDWLVFDAAGEGRGRVRLPQSLEVHQIGRCFVLGVWRDAMNVEFVHRYELDRGGGCGIGTLTAAASYGSHRTFAHRPE